MSPRFPSILLTLFILLIVTGWALAEDPEPNLVRPGSILILGPLPALPEVEEGVFPRGEVVAVPEIDPTAALPRAGQEISLAPGLELRWQEYGAGVPMEGAAWLAWGFRLAARAEVTIRLEGGESLFVDGQEWDLSEEDEGMTASGTLASGVYRVVARAQNPGEVVMGTVGVDLSFGLDAPVPVTRFEQLAGLTRAGSLAIGDGGKVLARRLSRREPALGRLDLMDGKGRLLATDLGGPDARPVAFRPASQDLLLRRSGADGTDLLLWQGTDRPLKKVLAGEPGLGLIRFSPDGRFLLFASTRAFEEAEAPEGPRRFAHLRERVIDFTPVPHLHLLEVATGARRVLTLPGDRVLDDAVFGPEGLFVYYGHTLHQAERPWFHSEIRRLDLSTGKDEELARFTGGWEVRPQGLAVSLDGETLIFLGPPEEVGGGRDEHNVYNKQVWSLDLDSGAFVRRTRGLVFGFDVGGGLPRFDKKGRLLVEALEGSRQVLTRIDPGRDWRVEVLPLEGESLGGLAVSPDGEHLLYTASTFDTPANLYTGRAGRDSRMVEEVQTSDGYLWADAVDATFQNDEGQDIDAWFYPPLVQGPDGDLRFGPPVQGKAPLVVYYYAGSVATLRGFNGTHQFFAANGYGVMVINPRGAYGFGDAYADHHAGDWGPAAGADIIAGTEHILASHDWLDEDGIGIYGGSYGGFMTEYLVTVTDIYDAAVSMYGISDLATYWGQGTWGWTYGDMALGGRFPWSDAQYFIEHSPLFQADRIHTPLLLLHGQEDSNVTPGESEQLFTALSVLDRTVEMVLFPGEDHGISGSWENRVGHREMILEWFEKHCRNQPAAWEARWQE